MLKRIHMGVSLLRHLGPRWAVSRVRQSVESRLGLLERRMPCLDWDELPLAGFLANPGSASAETGAEARRDHPVRFFFDPADRCRYQTVLREFDAGADGPVPRAEALLGGVLRHFERHDLEVGFPPDWFRNPFTGDRLPGDRHWNRVPTFAAGDIKCVWEASRFGFAYLLVRAYWRTGDGRFAEAFWRALEDWRQHNPPNSGPNWKCGQEAAFRLMAWIFGSRGLADAPATTAARQALLAQMVAVSAWRIERHLGYALSQQNNHGVSEATALWTVGLLFPEFRRAGHWQSVGRRWLERLGRDLIYEDGGFSQHSVNYHRVMLHDYLWAIRLGDLNDRPLSAGLKARVVRAGDWLFGMTDPASGEAPNWGGNDGALVLPLNNCPCADQRPVVQAVSVVLGGQRRFSGGPWDEDVLWLHGMEALWGPVVERGQEETVRDSGCHVLRRGETSVFVHCPTRFRHRPAHADLLHVDLRWRSRNLALDAGTYSYNAAEPWSSWFPGTQSHNTVTVDDVDQMDRVARFVWLPWPRGRWRRTDLAARHAVCWEGSHDGYCRLPDPVSHQRAVIGFGDSGWLVLDRVVGRLPHVLRLHWLLADLPHRWEPAARRLVLQVDANECFVALGCDAVSPAWSAKASEPGWVSRHYWEKEPALSLEGKVMAAGATFWTLFTPREAVVTSSPEGIDVRCGTDGIRARLRPPGDTWLLEEVRAMDSGGSHELSWQ